MDQEETGTLIYSIGVGGGERSGGHSQLFHCTRVVKELSECLLLQEVQVYWPSFCNFFPLSDSRPI